MKAAQTLGGPVWVVKAQIHAGGRGKAGGVKVVKSIDDVKKEATRILGSTLVTHQTGPKGKQVNRLYIEEGSAIEQEFYLSMLVDRATSRVAIVVSTEGGMDIEKVAHDTPDKIVTIVVDPVANICPHHVRRVSQALGLDADLQKQISGMLTGLYRAFTETDMSLLEINPLVITKDEKLLCLDAKSASTTTRCSVIPTSPSCATRLRRTRRRSRRRSTISTTSRSTARSAAW